MIRQRRLRSKVNRGAGTFEQPEYCKMIATVQCFYANDGASVAACSFPEPFKRIVVPDREIG